MVRLFAAGGSEAVQANLMEEWGDKSQSAPNAWETAAYRALADSEQYCSGDFGD